MGQKAKGIKSLMATTVAKEGEKVDDRVLTPPPAQPVRRHTIA